MKTIYSNLKFFVLLLLLMLPVNCKRVTETITDEDSATPVTKLQIVTIDAKGAKSGNSYNGTLNSKPLKILAAEDDKITLVIPLDATLGNNELSVPDLKGTFRLNVKEAVLSDNVENTINSFYKSVNNYLQTLEDSPENNSIKSDFENFKVIFQNAKKSDQQNMALFYQVNKSFYDKIFNYNFEDVTGRTFDYDEDLQANINLNKGRAAIYGLAISVASMVLIPDPFVKCVAFVGVLVTTKKAFTFMKAFHDEQMVILDHDFSGRMNSSSITLTSGITKTIKFGTKRRSVNTADQKSSLEKFLLFFKTFNTFDELLVQTNSIAEWLNSNIPLCDFSITPRLSVASTSQTSFKPITIPYFNRYVFSINNPDAVLSNVKFNSNGKIDVEATITNPKVTSVNTTINYTYKDNYNNFSGSLPVVITGKNILDGVWTMDLVLGEGECDETLLEDENNIPPTFIFNQGHTITFLTDPVKVGLNRQEFAQEYSFINNELVIRCDYISDVETVGFHAKLKYDPVSGTFKGYYVNEWPSGTICTNSISIYKK